MLIRDKEEYLRRYKTCGYNEVNEEIRSKLNPEDLKLYDELMKELEDMGIYIRHIYSLHSAGKGDEDIYPVVRKYYGKFKEKNINIELLESLGIPKLYEASEFLIDIYRNDTLKDENHRGLASIRCACANALYKIRDPRFQKE